MTASEVRSTISSPRLMFMDMSSFAEAYPLFALEVPTVSDPMKPIAAMLQVAATH
ncbi:hypothetical protein WAI453_008886 [Rhynchosporium graminicola]